MSSAVRTIGFRPRSASADLRQPFVLEIADGPRLNDVEEKRPSSRPTTTRRALPARTQHMPTQRNAIERTCGSRDAWISASRNAGCRAGIAVGGFGGNEEIGAALERDV